MPVAPGSEKTWKSTNSFSGNIEQDGSSCYAGVLR